MLRSGLRSVLGAYADIHVVGEAGDGVEAVELARRLLPDVLLVEARLPRRDGVAVAREVAVARLPVGVLVLTGEPVGDHAVGALRAGARGLVAQDAPAEDLVGAVRAVAAGHAAISPVLLGQLLAQFAALPVAAADGVPEGLPGLTDREREVLTQVARGLSNAEIARVLTVSETTVKTHVGHVLTKLKLRDRVQAVVYAYESGLVKPGE
ncbi:MAG: response regulator transcription factor [Hamadaea sp.]|nr:response regulator transcription factor [Hamadaea sp.]NUR47326.1 response regulator transcription factor [Hamadaea sp.]NUT08628.1 response regulator transcription factor [Hamadaea sp.]